MGQSKKQLAQLAVATAMKTRLQAGYSLQTLINIYDVTERSRIG